VNNVGLIQIMHQRTLVTQCQRGVHDHIACQRTYLVVCESELDFLTVFLDDPCVFRSNNKSCDFFLFLERLQEIRDGMEFPNQYVIIRSKSIGSAFRLSSASSMSSRVLSKFSFSANLSHNLSIRTYKLSTALRLSPASYPRYIVW
jgi:hypothetical protein